MTDLARIVLAPAKINLALAVSKKRDDGFHNIETVFQSIALFDRVEVRLRERGIVCDCGELSGEKNLAYKAADYFLKQYQIMFSPNNEAGVEITIEKNIPLQAGLAGGSSDAAAVLRGLNILFSCPFSYNELLVLARKCGSDTAFCLKGGTQWGEGTGSDLYELPPAPEMDIIVVKPSQGVDTAEAYRMFDEIGDYAKLSSNSWTELLHKKDIKTIGENLFNSLEIPAFQLLPEIRKVKELLLANGCSGVLMSGSGSAVFGILRSTGQGKKISGLLASAGFYNTWVVKTINCHRDNCL